MASLVSELYALIEQWERPATADTADRGPGDCARQVRQILLRARADLAFDVLVRECGAREAFREEIIRFLEEPGLRSGSEFRFGGNLRSGGKLKIGSIRPVYVSCYPEHTTPELQAMMDKANAQLAILFPDEW